MPVRGDILASGPAGPVLPWRERAVTFSSPIFPTQVWVMARASSGVRPIEPTGDVQRDIALVKGLLPKRTVLAVAGTCLDPALYALDRTGADVQLKKITSTKRLHPHSSTGRASWPSSTWPTR